MASAMIASGTIDLSDYNSRLVTIEVRGGHQEMLRKGLYTVTIPYRCLSQTMQRIHRFGGKVTNVAIPHYSGEALSAQPQAKPASNARQTPKSADETQKKQSQRKAKR
ncbi:MAG: phycobilisome linker polypeptide [Stenomitos rutilans HA7619-LM2]|jgi:hypothetical protein|nr:phycobilisome linker polypeptide [Stenomitos rutilans HA7619-LM2]